MPLPGRDARRTAAAWSVMPGLLATGLLAAGVGGAERMHRAERAVAARLSWCGVDERSVAIAQTQWQGQSTVSGRVSDVVLVPAGVSSGGDDEVPAQGLKVIAAPVPGGGWQVSAGDAATRRALGGCLDG